MRSWGEKCLIRELRIEESHITWIILCLSLRYQDNLSYMCGYVIDVLTWSFDFILFVQKLVSADYSLRVYSLAIDYCSVCSFSVPFIFFSTVSFVWSNPLVK